LIVISGVLDSGLTAISFHR